MGSGQPNDCSATSPRHAVARCSARCGGAKAKARAECTRSTCCATLQTAMERPSGLCASLSMEP